jgi:hypothetical protein
VCVTSACIAEDPLTVNRAQTGESVAKRPAFIQSGLQGTDLAIRILMPELIFVICLTVIFWDA